MKFIPALALLFLTSQAMAQPAYETDMRNFVEPTFKCPASWPPATNPSRAATLPPDIPDGAQITRVRMTNNSLWASNTSTWTLSYDRGGRWARSADYPAQQYGSFYQLIGLVYLNSPSRTADSGRIDPPIVYRTGDFFHVDLVCSGNGNDNAQPTWEVEFIIPTGTWSPNEMYAYGPTTVGGDNGLNTGLSLRTVSNPIGGSWSQVRVTYLGGSVSGLACQNVSVGVQASGSATVSTPVELLFGGAHGFNATSTPGVLTKSDWTNFTISSGNTLIVTCDGNTSVPNSPALVTTTNAGYLFGGSQGSYYKGAAQSYNVAAPTGFMSTPKTTYGLYSIEVR